MWLGPLWSHATVGLGPRSNATGDRAPVEPCNCVARSREQYNCVARSPVEPCNCVAGSPVEPCNCVARSPVESCNCVARCPEQCNWG